jgi:hypothetical protein
MIEIDRIVFLAPSLDELVFGPIDGGPEIGLVVLFEGGVAIDLTGELTLFEPTVGLLAGSNYQDNRVIIETDTGFLGWVGQDHYRVLNLVTPDTTIQ